MVAEKTDKKEKKLRDPLTKSRGTKVQAYYMSTTQHRLNEKMLLEA